MPYTYRGKKRRKPWVFKAAIALFAVVLLFFVALPLVAVLWVTGGHVSYTGDEQAHPLQGVYEPSEFGINGALTLTLETTDGLKLWASEVRVENPKGVLIYLSGIQQPSVTYFYPHAKWMRDNGYASLLLEVRAHGQSEGKRIGMGYLEVLDVQAAVDYLRAQPAYDGVPIVVHGVSMGGAVAANAMGQIEEIDGGILMSCYSSFTDVALDMMHGFGVPKALCKLEKPFFDFALFLVYGKNAFELKPVEQVKNFGSRPALFIAAAGDTEVLPENMTRIKARAGENCTFWLKDSWEHFIVDDCDFRAVEQDEEYCDRILGFLNERVATARKSVSHISTYPR